MGVKWTVVLFVAALLSCGSCENWMAGGNMTQDNLTVIMAKINAFDRKATTYTYAAFATTLSNDLNNLWAPAWNVVVVFHYDQINHDVVLYGYGFRSHWFWFNGFKVINSFYTGFIIWKDFNCVRWIVINPGEPGFQQWSFGNADKDAITTFLQGGYNGRDIDDIWLIAKDIQGQVPRASNTLLQDQFAYSVIAAQTSSTYFFSKVCAKDYIIVSNVADRGGSASGKVLILQMR